MCVEEREGGKGDDGVVVTGRRRKKKQEMVNISSERIERTDGEIKGQKEGHFWMEKKKLINKSLIGQKRTK